MKTTLFSVFGAMLAMAAFLFTGGAAQAEPLHVTTTLSGYAAIAQYVGGDKVDVQHIVEGYQDPHFVRPKPSLANMLTHADLFISTGMDLELWAPSLIDLSRNDEIRSGQKRYVAASSGVHFLEVPTVKSHSEGGVHIYGNPHLLTSPTNAKVIAKNIATGLGNIDPDSRDYYEQNYKKFCAEVDERLYGPELIKLVGASTLNRMVQDSNGLIEFLETHDYQGAPLIDKLGGWLAKGLPMRGAKVIGYHKNWAYFNSLYGLNMVNYVEPKPSIPPTPKHIEEVVEQMRTEHIGVVVAASYFPEDRVRALANKVGAKVVIVPLDVGGVDGVGDYFELMDYLVDHISAALK